jgi:hypothetical protein
MRRERLTSFVIAALLFAVTSAAAANPVPSLSEHDLTLRKLSLEVEKLNVETAELQKASLAISANARFWQAWFTAVGGGATTLLGALIGYLFTRTQRIRAMQDHSNAGEKQFLDVCRELGASSERVRLAAVGVLISRVAQLSQARAKTKPDRDGLMVAQHLPSIIGILINATKSEESETLQKYIADGLVHALGARLKPGADREPPSPSPLRAYDFQGAQLTNAWWPRVDAREVDFYRANLRRAGMREASLRHAVLKYADLRGAVLAGADLTRADLRGADLRGASLAGAVVSEARFEHAKIDDQTSFEKVDLKTADVGAGMIKLG